MSDGVQRTADGVFGGLEAFDDTAVDSDDMDPMFLGPLGPTTDAADWQLDVLGTDPDFYNPAANAPHIASQYIDNDPDPTPAISAPPPTPALPTSAPPTVISNTTPTNHTTTAKQTATATTATAAAAAANVLQQTSSSPSHARGDISIQQEALSLSTPPQKTSNSPPLNIPPISIPSQQPFTPSTPPTNATTVSTTANQPRPHSAKSSRSTTRIVKPIVKPSSSLIQHSSGSNPRSPISSGSSGRPRSSNASASKTASILCVTCGKTISGSHGQIRRHQRACKHQRDSMSVDAIPDVVTPLSPPTPSEGAHSDGTHSHSHSHSHGRSQPSSSRAGGMLSMESNAAAAGSSNNLPQQQQQQQQHHLHHHAEEDNYINYQQTHHDQQYQPQIQQLADKGRTQTTAGQHGQQVPTELEAQVHSEARPTASSNVDDTGNASESTTAAVGSTSNMHIETTSNHADHIERSATPNATSNNGPALNRRDADLLSVVRRLENSINTLDINARLCLRDALVSLSNKASNPAVPPTPQQEAMNRAAEYLVLRMLFLSGHQVMHTPPGTGAPYAETPVVTAAHHQQVGIGAGSSSTTTGNNNNNSNALLAGAGAGTGPGMPSSPIASLPLPHITTTTPGNINATTGVRSRKDDGTVAASTGTENASVAQPVDEMMDLVDSSSNLVAEDTEDKVDNGT